MSFGYKVNSSSSPSANRSFVQDSGLEKDLIKKEVLSEQISFY